MIVRSLRLSIVPVKLAALLLGALVALPLLASLSWAQGVMIPNFWDPKARFERPDLTGLRPIRFLVDDEFPPLHFTGFDGIPTGFSVELARAACERLAITCTVQVRRFDTLLDSLAERGGDVVAAAIPTTASLRQRFTITNPYFKIPARFVVRKDKGFSEPRGQALTGRSVAVVRETAHEAFLKLLAPGAELRSFADLGAAEAALRAGEVDYLFGDGLSLALWLGGPAGSTCCAFIGGPFLENRFFGEGIGFIVRRDDVILRRALDHALQRLWDEGKYAELYLRFFPVSPF
ncbi:transporter substrate-binding domain-containing protein [Microvirga massiliensis]|uniref:transporter substrate-binding domain-containing protein n=1 Tax=Microvirga massiliensis TaxID=1033741 RepID=UPI00062BD58B|nr:transporter substrate-binding domain-containing protein [Microvirga massiliensis]